MPLDATPTAAYDTEDVRFATVARLDPAEHLDQVRKVALGFARRLPRSVDIDELINAGTVGLYEAASRFEASRGRTFAAFAAFRIRGAILDALRGMDTVSRADRARVRAGDDLGASLLEQVDRGPGPAREVERREMRALLERSLDTLSARERAVLAMYYVEERTLKEIGAALSVTESRVCQIHSRAVATLRMALSAH
jgi:RNA polymerase sigma factor for flagellar operon FliA